MTISILQPFAKSFNLDSTSNLFAKDYVFIQIGREVRITLIKKPTQLSLEYFTVVPWHVRNILAIGHSKME